LLAALEKTDRRLQVVFLLVTSCRPHKPTPRPARLARFPSEDHSHAGALGVGWVCEGRHSEDHHQFTKKKTMKTTSQNQTISSELNNRSHHQSEQGQPTEAAAEAVVAPERKDNRLPIDTEARKQNRTLPTPKVLNLLHTQLPAAYRLAEVVGKWVWVRFTEQPTAEVRQQLAQLGFHWNRERQAWQHPCGQFRLSSAGDPHEKYSSYHPARIRRSTKKQTAEAAAA
jgi:hypothetical protein